MPLLIIITDWVTDSASLRHCLNGYLNDVCVVSVCPHTMTELHYFSRHIYGPVESESPVMTADDIPAMLSCSPRTCTIVKPSGTWHLVQVRAISLGKALQESAGSSDSDTPRPRASG